MNLCHICGGRLPNGSGGRRYCGMDCAVEAQSRSRRLQVARNPAVARRVAAHDRRTKAARRQALRAGALRFTGRLQAAPDVAIVRALLSDACGCWTGMHLAGRKRGG